ncbi:MAG: hypothetical protein K1X94_02520 [Sandaracinaceae bacterium]|nr:hypothetical protein [Sandaracinaceae bacterium]
MRRVMALWLSVALATLAGGLAVAQETATEPAPTGEATTTATAAPSEEVVTSSTSAAVQQADQEMDAGTYATRLRDLEQRIDALKEQIFRSKARLSLLAETVLQGVVAGAQAVIIHENRMSSSYRLVKVQYALDGARIFNKADEEGPLGDQTEFEVYNGSIVPGDHNITVNLEYRGNGYGIFSYLKGYRFRVRSSYTFNAPEGKAVTIRVVGYEKGGPTAPLEERPAVRYMERTEGRAARSDSSEGEASSGSDSGGSGGESGE